MENYTNQRYCQESSYNILIEIDYREHKTIKDFEEYFKNVEVKTLDTADYIISDKYTKKKLCYIERKTLADFISTEVDTSRYKTYEKMYRKNREINTKIYCIIVLQKKNKGEDEFRYK